VDVPGYRYSIGPSSPLPEDPDDRVALPFSPEVGGAVAYDDGFAVGALEPSGKSTSAVLVVLGQAMSAGKRIDLGKVHGDVLPPSVVGGSKALFVAIPDGAPNGTLLRLARVDEPEGSARVTWGADVATGRDESDAWSFELGTKVGILSWDEWDAKAGHGVVKAATFTPPDVGKLGATFSLSGVHDDAEAPAVVARPGGFWAAWVQSAKRPAEPKERHEGAETEGPVDMGPRSIVVEPLDEAGKPSATPVAVGPKDGHVTGFDLIATRDGTALVAWRDDATSPAAPGGLPHLAVVRADGSTELRDVTDDDTGAGAPTLLADAAPPGDAQAWLSLANDSDVARLGALDAAGHALDDLAVEPSLGTGEALAVRAGRLLVARGQGKGLELDVLRCEKGTRDAAGGLSPTR
jgi:hypothetical protein